MIYQTAFDETRFQSIFPHSHNYPSSEQERDYERRWNAIRSGTYRQRIFGEITGPDPDPDSDSEAIAKLIKEHPGKLTLCEPPRAAGEIMSVFCSYTILALTERLRDFPDFLAHFEKEGLVFPYPCEIPITRLTNWLSNQKTLARWPQVSRVGEQPVTLNWDGPFHLADPRLLDGLKVSLFFCNNWIHGLIDCELSDGGWQIHPNNHIRYYSFNERPVFRQSPPPGTWLFRVPENSIQLFCTGEFKDAYEHHGFKGMVFKPMQMTETWSPPPPPPPQKPSWTGLDYKGPNPKFGRRKNV